MREGVSDPALALFGPLRAGSLTPTCLVSAVLEEAARMCAQIVTGCVTNYEPRCCPVRASQRRDDYRAHSVVP